MFKVLNDILSFLLELAMLVAFGYAEFHCTENTGLQYVLGMGIPVIIILFWAQWMAPKAKKRLPYPWLLIVTLFLFEAAALSLYLAEVKELAVVFGIVALINVGIRFWFKNDSLAV